MTGGRGDMLEGLVQHDFQLTIQHILDRMRRGHAEDQIVFVDDSLVPLLEKVADKLETVRHYVVMGDGDAGSLPNALRYEELLADQEPGYDYPELDDRQAAGLCYTSGTTGNPKGVLYSHHSNLLHSF